MTIRFVRCGDTSLALGNLVPEVSDPEGIKDVIEADGVGVDAVAHDRGRGVISNIREGSWDLVWVKKNKESERRRKKSQQKKKKLTDPEAS